MNDRNNGKTTKIMEQTITILSELPENSFVFITGAHSKWLLELSHMFKDAGLKDVRFFTPSQIIQGALRGRKGVLLIDDEYDLTPGERLGLIEEQRLLHNGLGVENEIYD